jgi:hypothetical protein
LAGFQVTFIGRFWVTPEALILAILFAGNGHSAGRCGHHQRAREFSATGALWCILAPIVRHRFRDADRAQEALEELEHKSRREAERKFGRHARHGSSREEWERENARLDRLALLSRRGYFRGIFTSNTSARASIFNHIPGFQIRVLSANQKGTI